MTDHLLDFLRPYRKAVAAFVGPGLVVGFYALLPSSDGGSAITGTEWGSILTAMVGTTGLVFGVKNKAKRPNA